MATRDCTVTATERDALRLDRHDRVLTQVGENERMRLHGMLSDASSLAL